MREAFHLAAHYGAIAVVKELVAIGLTVNQGCLRQGLTPLHLAIAAGHHHVCEVLLDAFADVNVIAFSGETPHSMSIVAGHAEIVEAISKQLEARKTDDSQLWRCVSQSTPRAPPYLLEAILDS